MSFLHKILYTDSFMRVSKRLNRWITPTRFAWFLTFVLAGMMLYVLGLNMHELRMLPRY